MRRALVMGLGESGLAMARWLARGGAAVRIADTRPRPPLLAELRVQLPAAEFVPGPLAPEAIAPLLAGVELLALSPGLAPHEAPLPALRAAAAAQGARVVGEIELFAQALAELRRERSYAPQVLGITGTNGKTTTTRMLGAMLARWGRSTCVAGNISPSALDALRAALDAQALPDLWVLELSSFQLATTHSLQCSAAALLNLTQDHLDWHANFAEYAAAKARIFGPGTLRIYNRDDAQVRACAEAGAGGAHAVGFGAGAPQRPGDFGIVRAGGIAWLACTHEEAPARAGRAARRAPPTAAATAVGATEPARVHRLMPVDALPVHGTHNALNAQAALALARAAGCPLAPALHALREFAGEPHRTQTVAVIGGVEYVDDSKGTNVGATVAALRGLAGGAERPRGIVVILGGDGKGQDFAPLAEAVAAHARAVVLVGRDAPLIAAALRGLDLPVADAADLPAAVRAAAALARAGDIVLLSPACASLDAFRNYAHRAQVFVGAVRALPAGGALGREAG